MKLFKHKPGRKIAHVFTGEYIVNEHGFKMKNQVVKWFTPILHWYLFQREKKEPLQRTGWLKFRDLRQEETTGRDSTW